MEKYGKYGEGKKRYHKNENSNEWIYKTQVNKPVKTHKMSTIFFQNLISFTNLKESWIYVNSMT